MANRGNTVGVRRGVLLRDHCQQGVGVLVKFEKLRKLEGGGRLETKVTSSYVSRLGGGT